MKKQRVTSYKDTKICLFYTKTTDRRTFYKCQINKSKEVKKVRINKNQYLNLLKKLKK